LAVTDWRLRRWRLWFLALSNAPLFAQLIGAKTYLAITYLRDILYSRGIPCNILSPQHL